MPKPMILASTSPFRQALLKQLGFDFTTIKPEVDERAIEKNSDAPLVEIPMILAEAKARAVEKNHPDQLIIGSDQLLIFNNQALHKPKTAREVTDRLLLLQGQTHELHTGLCLLYQGRKTVSTTVARMTMHPLTSDQIDQYVQWDQPLGCAGGYKIEQRGSLLFSKIETPDHNSIIGLPTLSLINTLRDWGISSL